MQIFDCTKAIFVTSFSLRLHRIHWEFQEFSRFREFPEYSRFLAFSRFVAIM